MLTILLLTFVFGLFVHILGWTHKSEKSEIIILAKPQSGYLIERL